MDIHRPKEKLAALMVFLLPLLLVKGGGIVTGSGPSEAQATPGPKDPPPQIAQMPDPPVWSAKQREATAHIVYLKTQPFGPSPLLHVAPPAPDHRVDPVVTRVNPPPPPPNARVKAILTRRDGNHVALIDRRRYVVGDALGDRGWYIIKIDGPARAVMIEHRPTERTATLTVPLPR